MRNVRFLGRFDFNSPLSLSLSRSHLRAEAGDAAPADAGGGRVERLPAEAVDVVVAAVAVVAADAAAEVVVVRVVAVCIVRC